MRKFLTILEKHSQKSTGLLKARIFTLDGIDLASALGVLILKENV